MLGKVNFDNKRFDKAEQCYQLALNYLDVYNYAEFVMLVNLMLVDLSINEWRLDLACNYLKRVDEILGLDDSLLIIKATQLQMKSKLSVLEENHKVAKQYAHQAFLLHNKLSTLNIDIISDYRIFAIISLYRGEYQLAMFYLSKAIKVARLLSKETQVKEIKALQFYIESMNNYLDSTIKYQDALSAVDSDFGRYVSNSAKLLHASSGAEKESGRRQLKRLAKESGDVLVKYAAQHMLETGQIKGVL
jgi:tetratricopeptide (TPR) repeat protein